MKKIYLVFYSALITSSLWSQPVISVVTGTDLSLASGTILSSDGLSITPSSTFVLNGVALSRNVTVAHTAPSPYVSRVYKFDANTNPFSGTIRFNYADGELNGLNESTLRVNIHNGGAWQSITSATNDGINNFVVTNVISNRVLNELALSEGGFTLPLKWGVVSAYRKERSVIVSWQTFQEFDLHHFSIERSLDGTNWTTINDNIPPGSSAITWQYSFTDNNYNAGRILYRIKQVDIDTRFTYSPVVSVNAENDGDRFLVYPNPVNSVFHISNADPSLIKQVQLFNSNGVILRNWNQAQAGYTLHDLPSGIYQLKIIGRDGRIQKTMVRKQ